MYSLIRTSSRNNLNLSIDRPINILLLLLFTAITLMLFGISMIYLFLINKQIKI